MSLNQNGECALSICTTRRLNGSLYGNENGAAGSSQAFREMRPPQEEGNGSFLTQGGTSVFTERGHVQTDQGPSPASASASGMASKLQLCHLENGGCH